MTKEEIDILWHKAMRLSIEDGDQFTRYRFAELVSVAEREKWMERTAILIRGEREACAKVCDDQSKEFGGVAKGPFVTDFGKHTQMSMAAGAENCAAAIRARGETK